MKDLLEFCLKHTDVASAIAISVFSLVFLFYAVITYIEIVVYAN